MAFRLTPPVFAREARRRLMNVKDVQELTGLTTRQSVWNRVKAGTLPEPVLSVDRNYSLWDRDELERLQAKENGGGA
jgi:predicted DNA-binding transcriptional regulator AlpA